MDNVKKANKRAQQIANLLMFHSTLKDQVSVTKATTGFNAIVNVKNHFMVIIDIKEFSVVTDKEVKTFTDGLDALTFMLQQFDRSEVLNTVWKNEIK